MTVDENRRYTTRETMITCMRLARVDAWDFDVAAEEGCHWASRWFGVEQDGLAQEWRGRVWCNPPFDNIQPWVEKAHLEGHTRASVVAMLLPCNRTEQVWWQKLVEPVRDRHDSILRTHFLPGRVKFGLPGNPDAVGVGSPPFGCVLLVWRRSWL